MIQDGLVLNGCVCQTVGLGIVVWSLKAGEGKKGYDSFLTLEKGWVVMQFTKMLKTKRRKKSFGKKKNF